MAKKKTTVVRPRKSKTKTRQTRRLLPVLERLDIDVVSSATLNGANVDARLVDAITGIDRDLTIDGANVLTLPIHDPDRELLRADLLGGQIDLDLGRAGRWRMDRSRDIGGLAVNDDILTLRLWDRSSAALRAQTAPIRISSERLDIAGLARFFAREVRGDAPMQIVAPFPGDIPPEETTSSRSSGKSSIGFSASAAAKVKVKGARATRAQLKAIDAILAEATELRAGTRVKVAALMAATQESRMGAEGHTTGDDDTGYFQQGREWISAKNAKDPAKGCRAFLLGGEANVGGTEKTKKGWKQHFGSLSSGAAPSDLGAAIFKVQSGGAGANSWKEEAERTVKLWTGNASGSSSRTVKRPAQWRRGTSDGPESSWSALDREAKRLGRRRFIALPWRLAPRLVVASDQSLIQAQPHVTVKGLDSGILTAVPSIDIEGVKTLQEIELTVVASAWPAPPGAVAELVDFGPADGPWIVKRIGVSAGSDDATVTLQKPTTKVEAQPEATRAASATRGGRSASSAAQAFYSKGLAISAKNYPYHWSGGHASAGSPSGGGYDCSGYIGAACAAAGWGLKPGDSVPDSGWFASSWGEPGKGEEWTIWANGNHVFAEGHGKFEGRSLDTSPAYSAGNRARGPHVRRGSRSTAGFTPRHWRGH
ncbi:hypothetical protein [Patulibacter sp. SYSU D01012]|uniref:hypothetical protein n=1 Tax=Patulibacter sp. SYSU D01012 TaxID=2817381 RepID=UPI001B3033AA|nr:hypothetical protein [Patulibacter sp. SYSU D01012]